MAINLHSFEHAEDEYIDMEVSSYSNLFTQSAAITSSPQHHHHHHHHPREFEFQMSSKSLDREHTTSSPADELFYKGKLLPLHLPPRLQMVEKLLQNSKSVSFDNTCFEDFYSTPLTTTANTPTTTSTPFESCNISPSDSCRVSRELNPDEYFLEYSSEAMMSDSIGGSSPKKSWTKKKLKLMKQSSLGSKLKASKAYLKSFFNKSGCSEESSSSSIAAAKNIEEQVSSVSKIRESSSSFSNKYMKVAKKNPFGQIQKDIAVTGDCSSMHSHRRSFSETIKRHLTTKSSYSSSGSSSSSSSSHSTNGVQELKFFKRSSSSIANSEIENSIQGAIAHCKQSQQVFRSRKTLSEVGFCSFSAVCEEQERPAGLSRG